MEGIEGWWGGLVAKQPHSSDGAICKSIYSVQIQVERAVAADYDQVLREVSACLQSAAKRAA